MAEKLGRLTVNRKLHLMSEDEMQWKQTVFDQRVNTYEVAEREEAKAQRSYMQTKAESDVHRLVAQLLKNHRRRLLADGAVRRGKGRYK